MVKQKRFKRKAASRDLVIARVVRDERSLKKSIFEDGRMLLSAAEATIPAEILVQYKDHNDGSVCSSCVALDNTAEKHLQCAQAYLNSCERFVNWLRTHGSGAEWANSSVLEVWLMSARHALQMYAWSTTASPNNTQAS